MIPAPFEYEAAQSPKHAVELLEHFGEDAKVLAGGQSLLPLMKLRLAYASALVDVARIGEMSYVREDGDRIAIGAATRHEDIHMNGLLARACPVLAHAAGEVGDPQVRHRGTIGGSASHADPAGDMPCVLRTLDAEMVALGPHGTRTIPAPDFFTGLFETALAPQEILTEIRVPRIEGMGWSYLKFNPRAQDWAIVGVAVLVERDGRISKASVGLTSMGETPLRAPAVEDALTSGASPADAAGHAAENTSPPSDPLGSGEYRRAMAQVIARRAVEEALDRCPPS